MSTYTPTDLESAAGYVPGYTSVPERTRQRSSPRSAFDDVLRRALLRPPCVIAFSGGRDSSAVLAAALRLARAEGLPMPIPVSQAFPADPEADERAWQDLVLSHLAIEGHWVDATGSHDLLHSRAQELLLRHGPSWPATFHTRIPLLELARGGSLVDGEGGDEVLGAQRITPLVATWRRRWRPDRQIRRAITVALAPTGARSRLLRRDARESRPWLRLSAAEELSRLLVEDEASQPLSWAAGVRRVPCARASVHGLTTLQVVADDNDVRLFHPFLDRAFVDAWAERGGTLGFTGRTEAMRHLFSDVLPERVLARQGKASFNASALGPAAVDFAASWSGGGVPTDLVDPDVLRQEWLSRAPRASSLLLLQRAWWAANKRSGRA